MDIARRTRALAAVRSGGHSVAGNCTCEGGMVIDLAGIRGGGRNVGIVTEFEFRLHASGRSCPPA